MNIQPVPDPNDTPDAVGLFLAAANDDLDALAEILMPVINQAFGFKGHDSTVADRARLVFLLNDLARFGGVLLTGMAEAAEMTPDGVAASWFDYRERAESEAA